MALQDMAAIQQKVIRDALVKLDACGCKYAIMLPDGSVLGELEVINRSGVKRHRINHFTQTGYIARVDAMKVGDVEVFDGSAVTDIENYRSAIGARAIRVFGKGSAETLIKDGKIELLRKL